MAPLLALYVGVALAQAEGGIGAVEASETVPLAPLASGSVPAVELDALGGRLTLRGVTLRGTSTLCPSQQRRAGAVSLGCASRKMRARIEVHGTGGARRSVLVLSRMRGSPAIDGDATLPLFPYSIPELGIAPCTATDGAPTDGGATQPSASVRGECALMDGRIDDAIAAFSQALVEEHHAHAALRLGDIAWMVDDVERAAAFWDSVGTAGPWTRLAAARLCDVLGACARQAAAGLRFDPLDAGGLPDVAFDELVLRRARDLAYSDRVGDAVSLLVAEGDRACRRAPALCRRLALEAALVTEASGATPSGVRDHDSASRATELLALVLTVGLGDDATSAALTGRTADLLAGAGVPRLGAELLASTARERASSEATLLRAAELYLESGDDVQAATIARYASARRQPAALALRWRALETQLGGGSPAGVARATTIAKKQEPRR